MSQRTVAINKEDFEILKKLALKEERTMKSILHRALTMYKESKKP